MIARWLTYLSFVCFGLLSLMVLQMTKRPLCIDSRVVERIDRLSNQDSDTIYRCALNKETPYSEYFGQQVRELGSRIQSTERVLESLEPFYKKVQITIMEDHPYLYRIQGHHLYIGPKLLDWREGQSLALDIDDEHRQAIGSPLDVLRFGRAGDDQHLLRRLNPRNPNFLAVQPPAIAITSSKALDFQAVRPGIGLGQRHAEIHAAADYFRQQLRLHGFGTEA